MINQVLNSNKLLWIAAILASILTVFVYAVQVDSPVATTPVRIGFIGDSITYGPKNASSAVAVEASVLGEKYALLNRGVSGATSKNWLPGQAMYDTTLAYFKAQHVSTVSIMLGTNDARGDVLTSPAMYKKNMQAIVNNLLQAPGIERVVINYPLYVVPGSANKLWGNATPARLKAYMAQLDTLVDGTRILRGDTEAYAYFKAKQNELTDGIHPTAAGYTQLGKLWADAYVRALSQPSSLRLGYKNTP